MKISSQYDLTQAFRAQLRQAGRMMNPKSAAARNEPGSPPGSVAGNCDKNGEKNGDGSGEGSSEGSKPAITLSEAVMRKWSDQVASRRLLTCVLHVPEKFGDHDERWDGSMSAPKEIQPPALRLLPKGVSVLGRYAGEVSASHPRRDADAMPGGAVVVDLDEAVHGGYAMVKDMQALVKGGFEGIMREYQGVAQHWAEAPLEAVGHAVAPASAVALGINVGVGAPLAYLAWKAAREGYQAIGECRANGDRLALRSKAAQQNRDELDSALKYLNTEPPDAPQAPVKQTVAQHLLAEVHKQEGLRLASQHNKLSGQIGRASLLSGASILGKVGIAAPMSAGFSIASAASGMGITGSSTLVAQNAAAATAATVGGIATTALSFPAAIGAIALGALFTRKSMAQEREFSVRSLPARVHLHRALADLPVRDERDTRSARTGDYCHFVLAKVKMRKNFYKHFKRMNIGFLGGSTLYGAGAMGTGAAAVAAAAAGLSNPIGWGVLTTLGTVGGIVMAGNSMQFLRGHHRQQRYDSYAERDDPLLDRDFLSTVDLLNIGAKAPGADQRGLELRARFYDMIGRRDDLRQSFLRSAAADLGRYYSGQVYHSDDISTRADKKAAVPTLLKRLSALVFKCGGRFLPWRRGGFDLRSAMFDINTKGRRGYTALSQGSLVNWLSDPANYGHQIEFMSRAMGEQSAYLRQKIAVRQELLEKTAPQAKELEQLVLQANDDTKPAISRPGEVELAGLAAATRFLGKLDEGMERDCVILAEMMLLERELSGMRLSHNCTRARLSLLKERFMSMYESNPYNPRIDLVCSEEAIDQQFAGWIHGRGEDGAEQRMRHLRGMLVDTEMQATELRELVTAVGREDAILIEEASHGADGKRGADYRSKSGVSL